MKQIIELEKQLEPKRKSVLYALRDNNWDVTGVENEFSDWALDEKWFIESTRENKGYSLTLVLNYLLGNCYFSLVLRSQLAFSSPLSTNL